MALRCGTGEIQLSIQSLENLTEETHLIEVFVQFGSEIVDEIVDIDGKLLPHGLETIERSLLTRKQGYN